MWTVVPHTRHEDKILEQRRILSRRVVGQHLPEMPADRSRCHGTGEAVKVKGAATTTAAATSTASGPSVHVLLKGAHREGELARFVKGVDDEGNRNHARLKSSIPHLFQDVVGLLPLLPSPACKDERGEGHLVEAHAAPLHVMRHLQRQVPFLGSRRGGYG